MKFIVSAFFILLISTVQSQPFIIKDIKSFGAKGDGKTNDQAAFRTAADYFNKHGGNGKLIISKGTYIVGKQIFTGGKVNTPAYTGENVMKFSNIKNFTISGDRGSIIKFAPGLRFGAFKPTGEVYDHGNNYFVNVDYMAQIGYGILIDNCSGITITGITMDGNSDNFILGGVYGDVGRQVPHTGIYIEKGKNIKLENDYVHHFGLDGITVANPADDSPDNISTINVTSEYNGRQGLSWVGGNGLYAKNCKFNHTGKGKVSSAPGAGLDIEAESTSLKNGVFEDCEFIDNSGCGMAADSGNSSDCTFTRCTFWGTTGWSAWVKKPGFTFNNCKIYGSFVHGFPASNDTDATKFNDCSFEDKEYDGKQPYGGYLIESNIGKRMAFTNCTFTSNLKRTCWLQLGVDNPEDKYQLINCKFIINNTNLPTGDFVGVIRGAVLNNCTFTFTASDAKIKRYYIGGYGEPSNINIKSNTVIYTH